MIDITKPVQTRDGRKVEITQPPSGGIYSLVGKLFSSNGDVTPECWTEDGKYCFFTQKPDSLDLVNVPAHTLESLCLEGFDTEVFASSGSPKYRVKLSKNGINTVAHYDNLQQAIDGAYDAWVLSAERDYKSVLYVFNDGSVTTSLEQCNAFTSLGVKQIARKEISFRARPGDKQ